jgi:hypothetical protein
MAFPESLPKFQLYDYVYLNIFAEQQNEGISEPVRYLLSRIPVMPSLAYGEIFFKKEIYNQIKAKINLSQFRTIIENSTRS